VEEGIQNFFILFILFPLLPSSLFNPTSFLTSKLLLIVNALFVINVAIKVD
jgi:hypothetical protein